MEKRRKPLSLQTRKAIAGYLFILPFLLGFLLFLLKPLAQSLYMSFCKVDVSVSGYTYNFIGLDNYAWAFLRDAEFNQMLVDEFRRMCLNSLAVMVFSFFTALILNQKFRGRALVRMIFFLPVILASGVILGVETNNSLMASIQQAVENTTDTTSVTTAIQDLLVASDVGVSMFSKVFEVVDGIYDVAIASGIQIIIFLSGLQTIPESIYEAADIEGCTAWEKLWKVTFPMISSLFLVNWIYTIVDFCMRTDSEIMEKIRLQMVVQIEYGFASAMAWIYFLITIVIIGISSLIISKGVYYYD